MRPLSEQLKPDVLRSLGTFSLMARNAVAGIMSGLHRSVSKGSGGDFQQYRQYAQGDDLRYVDWKLYARQERLYHKVCRDDTIMRCAVLVDASASMAYQGCAAPLSKYQYAAILAACFAALAAAQNDSVSLFVYGDKASRQIEFGRRDSLAWLVDQLGEAIPSGKAAYGELLQDVETFLGSSRGLVVIASDFIDCDIASLLKRFSSAERDLRICHVLDEDELELPFSGTVRFKDAESGDDIVAAPDVARESYKRAVDKWLEEFRNIVLEGGALYHFGTSRSSFLEYFC